MVKPIDSLITDIPLTAEAREALLNDMFADMLPHYGELFVPGDNFYINQHGPKQAQHMVVALCRWLGIKPGYIGLEFESVEGNIPDGQRYTIYIEAPVLHDEFLLGRALAYALTRYLIEERKQIHLPSADQLSLLAAGSVVFGLELVVMNGLWRSYGWFDSFKHRFNLSTGTQDFDRFFEANYEYLSRGFMKNHRISPTRYSHSLAPWAARQFGIKTTSKATQAVRVAEHTIKLANLKFIGVLWLIVVVAGIGSFTLFSRVWPPSTAISNTQQQVDMLSRLAQECKDSLAYQKQYADLADIQTVRNLNSISLRCESLNNQYQAAQQTLEKF